MTIHLNKHGYRQREPTDENASLQHPPTPAPLPFQVRSLALAVGCACLWSYAANATNVTAGSDDANPADLPQADLAIQAKPTDQWTGLWSRQNLLGDMGGLRSRPSVCGAATSISAYSMCTATI